MEDWISRMARDTAERVMKELQAETLAAHEQGGGTLYALFSIEKTAKLKKLCKQAEVGKKEFSQTIFACEMGLLPWRHELSRRDFVPPHLEPTPEEMAEIGKVAVGQPIPKALRKIVTQFDERRMLVGHLFYNDDLSRWHLLYFDQRDTDPHHNHWVAGSHIHVINWVIRPGQSADVAWQQFHLGNPNLSGSLHVRMKRA
jgi:hypothetical protein